MGYIGTSTLLKSLGISKKALYSLVNSGEVASPRKQGGRYLWSEQEATEIVCALARRSTQGALAFDQQEKRYLGGKAKYSAFIRETADAFCPGFESFADYFAGTGGSAEAFSDKTLLVNDLLYSSYLFLLAWYGPEWADMPKLSRWIGEYNRAVPAGENYVSEQFGGTYFGPAVARKIGFVREDIEQKYAAGEMNARERAILLASLLQAMDGAANIYAHYDTFKAPPVKWAPLEMRLPAVSNENDPENRVFQTDANMLAAYTYSDVAYLDPPVDSRQYGDIYHLPENIAQWAKPELRGKTKKVARAQGKSLYCKKGAAQVFAALVEGCKAKCILAALPEKQEGRGARSSLKLSAEEMLACLRKRGEVHIVFPPLPPKTPAEQQLLLSYEFKKKEENPRESTNKKGGLLVCQCGTPPREWVDSPINFTGGKYRELSSLLPYFPADIRRMWDVFSGGCSVGVNVPARQTVFIDQDEAVTALFTVMRAAGDGFLGEVERVISEFALSRSWEKGYEFYGVAAEAGLANVNKEAYARLRTAFNAAERRDTHYYAMLYVLIVYGFNNMPRFNRMGEFNLPVGKRDWNASMQGKLRAFLRRLQEVDATFLAMDFRHIDIASLSPGEDFLYLDPPYLGAAAYYNRQSVWTEREERALMRFLDQLDAYGVRYALSTTLSYGGTQNKVLARWLEQEASRHRIFRQEAQEGEKMLILNY